MCPYCGEKYLPMYVLNCLHPHFEPLCTEDWRWTLDCWSSFSSWGCCLFPDYKGIGSFISWDTIEHNTNQTSTGAPASASIIQNKTIKNSKFTLCLQELIIPQDSAVSRPGKMYKHWHKSENYIRRSIFLMKINNWSDQLNISNILLKFLISTVFCLLINK